jgi:hypothetical protein
MNLRPVPLDADVEELRQWCIEAWDFLRNPAFESLRLVPRASAAASEKGRVYYDLGDDKFKGYTGSYQEFGDIT